MTNERIAFVDYIRVVACLLVMVVHACEQFYNMGPISQVATEDNRLWVSVYDGIFGRISVPLFMIVSASCHRTAHLRVLCRHYEAHLADSRQ